MLARSCARLRARVVARRARTRARMSSSSSSNRPTIEYDDGVRVYAPDGMERVLFSECGFGADQHGQDATKAALRACRNAIEFNSIP